MPPPCTIAFLDCFSGISGDMFLAALIDAGLPRDLLLQELKKLNLGPFDLEISATTRQGLKATELRVSSRKNQQLRTLTDLLAILDASTLAAAVTRPAAAVFQTLAAAEARVHGIDIDRVHFHEIGALDTIVDVVGVVIGLDYLGIRQLTASPLPLGGGMVDCAHGRLPLPAPAVCELLREIPVYGVRHTTELVTPTGAALVKVLADAFGPLPAMTMTTVGYGAGSHTLADDQPNLLRLIIGTSRETEESQRVQVIESNLDDWSPEGFPYLCEQLLAGGALDVNIAPIQMKKGRPAFRLQVISHPAHSHRLKEIILSETTAIGLRFREEERLTLERQQVKVETPWGDLEAKRVLTPAGPRLYPEYEECRSIAARHRIPLQEVYRAVLTADEKDLR
jgi:uncharacterized protein (TIGR00299 family) protein